MKILHIADLHLGKRINDFSLLAEQAYMLEQIAGMAVKHQCEAVVIAGDIYDRSTPAAEAVPLLDGFITNLSEQNIIVLAISGNHDSPDRLDFGSRIFQRQHIHIAARFEGAPCRVTLTDEYGEVCFYLLPFVRPSQVRQFYPEQEINSYQDALRVVIQQTKVDASQRNVLVAHQFVTSGGTAERCDSESISVGGQDNVDVSLFDAFDYVALGHLHGPQQVGRPSVRYAGSPCKYSFSEARHCKSAVLLTLGAKGELTHELLPIHAQRDMREIKGSLAELLSGSGSDDFLRIILTNEERVIDAMSRLRSLYPNVMKLDFDNKFTAQTTEGGAAHDVARKTPLELFCDFYRLQWNDEPGDDARALVARELERLKEDEPCDR